MQEHNLSGTAEFVSRLVDAEFPGRARHTIRLLDFGCGRGGLVRSLIAAGYDAYGCDLAGERFKSQYLASMRAGPEENWPADLISRLGRIAPDPYRLPYEDDTFDVIVSTSVLEHVSNHRAALEEIRRVTRHFGVGLHLFPSKHYLPAEPHIRVPFASWMWPDVPQWWLSVWALAGMRTPEQGGMGWRAVVSENREYCREGIRYLSVREYRELFQSVFGSFEDLAPLYARHAPGGTAALARRLGGGSAIAGILCAFRYRLIGHRKLAEAAGARIP